MSLYIECVRSDFRRSGSRGCFKSELMTGLAVIGKLFVAAVARTAFQIDIMGLVGVFLVGHIGCTLDEFLIGSVTSYATFLGFACFKFIEIIRMAIETINPSFLVGVIEVR